MFEVAFLSIIGLKLGRTGTSFTRNQADQSSASKRWKWGLMMVKVLFITRSLTAGGKSGTCQITTWEDLNTTQYSRKHVRKYFIWVHPPQRMWRFRSISIVSRVAYLSLHCQLRQVFIHIFQSIALLKSLKHTVDLFCVIRGPWTQCELCHLSRSEHW